MKAELYNSKNTLYNVEDDPPPLLRYIISTRITSHLLHSRPRNLEAGSDGNTSLDSCLAGETSAAGASER